MAASNKPSLVLYLLWPPSAVGTFTATVRLPRALQVDRLICLHRFLLVFFWMIPVTLDAHVISPLVLALVTRLNLSCRYGLFSWKKFNVVFVDKELCF
jgi:hypothetical protein